MDTDSYADVDFYAGTFGGEHFDPPPPQMGSPKQ